MRALLCDLTGAEDATLVNNNAAAVLLVLNTVAGGREAVVSRGELIEIGGAFRMPDIMARAGARLVEVGTTNRTHAKDYRAALGPQTGVILKVHTSNYRIQGFTAEVGAAELVEIADAAGVVLMNDLGSGTLVDLSRWGLAREPTVREAVAQGAGVVTFSGDKLLGGPQAGIIIGRRDEVELCRHHPLARATRIDKLSLAGLEATLALYRDPELAREQIPVLSMLTASHELLARRAQALAQATGGELVETVALVGGGALPLLELPGPAVALDGPAQLLARALRSGEPAVVGRIEHDRLLLDPRTLTDAEVTEVGRAVRTAMG